jgi:hypothetical protein
VVVKHSLNFYKNMKEDAKSQIAHDRHMKKMWRAIYILAAVAVVLGIYFWVTNIPPPNGQYTAFAQCIASSGATFYGAFWCPHCAAQKAEFGDAVKYLPYVECSLPDASGQDAVCNAKGITGYPTWYYANGASSTGVQTLAQLSQATGCPLPSSTN